MMNKLNTLAVAGAAALALSAPVSAEYLYGFGSVSANYLDWTDKTEERAGKGDFLFLEAEGGAGFTWGDVYGFIDLENPFAGSGHDDANKDTRTAIKGNVGINTPVDNVQLFAQVYNLADSSGYNVVNQKYGLRYTLFTESGFWAKPFIATHYAHNSYDGGGFAGLTGGTIGWVAGYDFQAAGQKFSVSNWHETDFARDEAYNEDSVGHDGAIALWWHATDNLTAGLQYRYSHNNLGSATYQDGMIYTVKYNF
ncbi:outer membrane protein OmpK [Ferrimonas pelagia]|uniref:Outer membrane protein OmpK n=1 Tax=Ferrimonas pelagia TaxID=1177826 RepID=A0ABP9ED53_9GAMM